MSAATHTPGPWIFERDDGACGNRPYITTVARCCDYVIGLPSSISGGNYRDGDPEGDPEADARLIASAPELLEALIAMHHAFGRTYLTGSSPSVDAARTAIAKATGGAA